MLIGPILPRTTVPEKGTLLDTTMNYVSVGTLPGDFYYSNSDMTGKGMFAHLNWAKINTSDAGFAFGVTPWRYAENTTYIGKSTSSTMWITTVGNATSTQSSTVITVTDWSNIDIIWTLDGIWINGRKLDFTGTAAFTEFCNALKNVTIWHGFGTDGHQAETTGCIYHVQYRNI